MLHGHFKALLHALADGDGGNDHDEFRPAILLIQLKHGLDIDICFPGARLHLDIQAASPHVLHQDRGLHDVVLPLDITDVLEELLVRQGDLLIPITELVVKGELFHGGIDHVQLGARRGIKGAQVAAILRPGAEALAAEYPNDRFYRVGLIILDFEVEFHFWK